MTKQEILISNKLIAEFMGGKMIVTDYHGINIIEFPDKSTKDLHGLKYHNSWDVLMTVVEKIESLTFGNTTQFNVVIDKRGCCITQYFYGGEHQRWQTGLYNSLNKIESAWTCVISFIKWFNTVDKTNLNESK